jgi:predicted lipoprotein with Yx(FWY)xxD motif
VQSEVARTSETRVTGLRLTTLTLVVVLACAFTGCGGNDGSGQQAEDAAATQTTSAGEAADSSATDERAADSARRPGGEEGLRVPAERARIVADDSDFGTVLFDANGQVVYVFEKDRPGRSNCTSECAKAWPPVLTREQPSAGAGVDAGLLGTIRRADGMLQVTYNERPLYFYEHEGPSEIKCHNVDLHGGLWWVVTARGDPAG